VFGGSFVALDEIRQRIAIEHGVGVERHDDIEARLIETAIERGRLAGVFRLSQELQPIEIARVDDGRGPIRRSVVDDEHFEWAGVILVGDRANRIGDRSFLVVGGDQDRNGRVAARSLPCGSPIEHQARDQECIHEARRQCHAADREPCKGSTHQRREIVDPGHRDENGDGKPTSAEQKRQDEFPAYRQIKRRVRRRLLGGIDRPRAVQRGVRHSADARPRERDLGPRFHLGLGFEESVFAGSRRDIDTHDDDARQVACQKAGFATGNDFAPVCERVPHGMISTSMTAAWTPASRGFDPVTPRGTNRRYRPISGGSP